MILCGVIVIQIKEPQRAIFMVKVHKCKLKEIVIFNIISPKQCLKQ